jgi:hypothetical protein
MKTYLITIVLAFFLQVGRLLAADSPADSSNPLSAKLMWKIAGDSQVVELLIANQTSEPYLYTPTHTAISSMGGGWPGYSRHDGVGTIISCLRFEEYTIDSGYASPTPYHYFLPDLRFIEYNIVQVYAVPPKSSRRFIFHIYKNRQNKPKITGLVCDTSYIKVWSKSAIINRIHQDSNFVDDNSTVHLNEVNTGDEVWSNQWFDLKRSGYIIPNDIKLYSYLKTTIEVFKLYPVDATFENQY